MIESTTGTSIKSYLDWVEKELSKKDYGKVSITFTVHQKVVTDVEKVSIETEHTPLKKKIK